MALARELAESDSGSTPSLSSPPKCNNASQRSPRARCRRSIQILLPSETPSRLSNGKRSFTPLAIEKPMKNPENAVTGRGIRRCRCEKIRGRPSQHHGYDAPCELVSGDRDQFGNALDDRARSPVERHSSRI